MLAGYSIVQLIILVIVIAAVVAIAFVILRAMGVEPPAYIIQICWIILACVVGIFAIQILLSLVGRA